MPDRELYYKYGFLRDMPMKRFIASMGCPYPCTFCHEPVIRSMYRQETKSDYVRRKSVRRTVDEIKYIADRYPAEARALLGRSVLHSQQLQVARRVRGGLSEGSRHPVELQHPLRLGAASIAADLLEKAKCYGAAVGLESGNQEIREVVIRKQSKNDHIVEGARLLREKGIKVLTTNMVGLPGETLDNALETVELNMVLKSNYVRANTFLLFPGLPLVEYAKQNGYLDKDFDIDKHVAEAHGDHASRRPTTRSSATSRRSSG